jgi:AcrR family transcriptional regulator
VVRTANEQRPADLLDMIVDHLAEKGFAEFSLRPLAKAVRCSPRVILYYFGSKEELMVKALAGLRERQKRTFESIKSANFATPTDTCRAIWKHMSSPRHETLFRMFFEAYAAALRRPQRFPDFLHNAVEDWLEFVSSPLVKQGWRRAKARAFASVVVAGFRGFMLDYCASRDRKRLDRAVDLWLESLSATMAKEN